MRRPRGFSLMELLVAMGVFTLLGFGAMAFLLITAYLMKKKLPSLYTLIPMVFMLAITLWALVLNLADYVEAGYWHLAVIGSCVLVLAVWIVIQTIKVVRPGAVRAD